MINKTALREGILRAFSLGNLAELCADIEQDLMNDGIDLILDFDMLAGEDKAGKVLDLINYLDNRGYLNYLVGAVHRARPKIDLLAMTVQPIASDGTPDVDVSKVAGDFIYEPNSALAAIHGGQQPAEGPVAAIDTTDKQPTKSRSRSTHPRKQDQTGDAYVGIDKISMETISLRNATGVQSLFFIVPDAKAAKALAFAPDSKSLAAGGLDSRVHLWDLTKGKELYAVEGRTGSLFILSYIEGLCFTHDGQTLISGANGSTVFFWKVVDGKQFYLIKLPSQVECISLTPDSRILAIGLRDCKVQLWDVEKLTELFTLKGHRWSYAGAANSVAFAPNGHVLASAGSDRTVRLWRVADGECLAVLQGHSKAVRTVAFSPDGKILASGGNDHRIELWRINSDYSDGSIGERLRTLNGHIDVVRGITFTLDGQVLISAGEDRTVRLWRVKDGQLLLTLTSTEPLISIALSPNGELFATGSTSTGVQLWGVQKVE